MSGVFFVRDADLDVSTYPNIGMRHDVFTTAVDSDFAIDWWWFHSGLLREILLIWE